MFMLSCMIGPPSGLNLRNILWHGFASPSEISQELVMLDSTMHEFIYIPFPLLYFRYAYLFFVIVSTLGKMLQSESAAPSLPFSHRPFITFPQETQFANIFTGKLLSCCSLLN